MRTSQRELRGLATAAGLGMGYPHGLAEELARAVVWLTVRGIDGLGALLDVGPVASVHPDDLSGAVHVGLQGPGVLDLLIAEPDVVRELHDLDSAWLFVGLCGVAALRHDVSIELSGGNSSLTVSAGTVAVDLARRSVRALADTTDGPLHVTCHSTHSATPGVAATAAGPQVARLSVDDERWRAAEQLAAKTYVPTSEHSRHHGAGAGVTDND